MRTEQAAAVLSQDADYRVLRRVRVGDEEVFAQNTTGEPCGRLAVIDTETTGLNVDLGDRIIDLAIATCEYGRESGRLYRVVARYESLEDPEGTIAPEITRLTGITNEMVHGHRIDEAGVAQALDGVGLVVCHNAAFDRGFLEARYPAFCDMHFACSLYEVPWESWGINSSKLDYLGFRFGLFHAAHRARADVDMLLALLAQQAPDGVQPVLAHLLGSARLPSTRIHAIGLPFASKDIAKAHGYRWHDGKYKTPQAWWIETGDEPAERAFLQQLGCKKPEVIRLTARERYRSFAVLAEDLEMATATAAKSDSDYPV